MCASVCLGTCQGQYVLTLEAFSYSLKLFTLLSFFSFPGIGVCTSHEFLMYRNSKYLFILATKLLVDPCILFSALKFFYLSRQLVWKISVTFTLLCWWEQTFSNLFLRGDLWKFTRSCCLECCKASGQNACISVYWNTGLMNLSSKNCRLAFGSPTYPDSLSLGIPGGHTYQAASLSRYKTSSSRLPIPLAS